MDDCTPMREMPRYQCHKQVWALKIKAIQFARADLQGMHRGPAVITPEDDGYGPFEVDERFVMKHQPQVGGYYVVYDDGYKSFSPADAFESGYTLIR